MGVFLLSMLEQSMSVKIMKFGNFFTEPQAKEPQFNSFELVIVFGSICFILFGTELVDWVRGFYRRRFQSFECYNYDEDCEFGPVSWKENGLTEVGCRQSPINLSTRDPVVVNEYCHLKWSDEYSEIPFRTILSNEGHAGKRY